MSNLIFGKIPSINESNLEIEDGFLNLKQNSEKKNEEKNFNFGIKKIKKIKNCKKIEKIKKIKYLKKFEF